ncbi:MAG TPA: response regulator [Terriglobales bacterium]|jgi:chemotaxis family two-component system response regulator Rcp1|nr:response regulator [Terriglobales bacterium]
MNNQLADSRPLEVLLVEDNLNDVQLMRHGFTTSKLLLNLHHVGDGEQCLNFLRKQGQYFNAPTPDLILLDLNMPRMGGREVLMEMLADDNLSHLPVVVLTASAQDRETFQMYKLRCSSYIVKPIDFDQFLQVIGTIANYWFTVVVLPPSVERAKGHAGA